MRIGMGLGLGMGGRAPWVPTALGSSLALWLRADLGVTLNGATVSAWADQSGNGRHATQGTAGKQPTYVASTTGLNNQPSLLFSRALQTFMDTGALATIAQPLTVLVVARSGTLTTGFNHLYDITGAGGGQRILAGSNGSKQPYAYAGASIASPTVWSDGVSKALLVQLNGASSAIYDGSIATPVASGNAGALGCGGLMIGNGNGAAATLGWDGGFSEIALVSGASETIRTNLMRYAGSRYGITVA